MKSKELEEAKKLLFQAMEILESLEAEEETKVKKEIKEYSADVIEVADYLESKIKEEKPHLVLLDLILPGIDGFEVLSRMREDPSLSSIPVIILSNLGQKEDIERGLKLGAVDYLIKAHFTPGEIIEKIKASSL